MRESKRLILVPVAAAIFLLSGLATFYSGRYVPPNTPPPDVEKVVSPSYTPQPFVDSPEKRRGTLAVDASHFNNYEERELSIILSRVSSRGYDVQYVGSLTTFMGSEAKQAEREALLEEGLRSATSYLVVLPWNEFTLRERELVKGFVDRGGRVVMVGDATRRYALNSLAQDFGLIFSDDYLYNVKEHEANFQYIFLRDFQPNPLTQGLRTVVFYTASSIAPDSNGIILTDANTYSSARERSGRFAAMAQAAWGRVMAISDLTFMTPPYNSSMDNERLISNIADFLTTSDRAFRLAEFPHFFGSQVDVVVGRDELLGSAQSLISILSSRDHTAEVRETESFLRETAFLGLWQDSRQVEHYLSGAGIQVGDTLSTPFSPDTRLKSTALILLHENQGRHMLIILGDSVDTVKESVALLKSGQYRQGLVSDNLVIYPMAEAAPPKREGAAPIERGR